MAPDPSTAFDGPLGQFSIRDLLTILFKRRMLIVVSVVSVMAIVLTVSLFLPRIYEVSATLLVNRARAEVPMAPSDSGQIVVGQVSEQDLNSEIEVLRSRQILEEVVGSLDVEESAPSDGTLVNRVTGAIQGILGSRNLSESERLVVDLQEKIFITPVRRSNVIRITYRSDDPEWATEVVSTLTDRYLEQRTERFQSQQAVSFFEQQMRDAEQRLLDSEDAVENYVEGSSVTMVDGPEGSDSLTAQKELLMNRLSSLENDLGDAQVAFQSRQSEVLKLREQLASEPERLESSSRNNQDATTEEVERALATLMLERDALLQDFKPTSRHVRDIDTQIKMAEDRLDRAQRSANVSGTETNPVFLQLKGDLLRAESELEGTRARINSLRLQVTDYREDLSGLNDIAFGLDGLRREAQAAEEDYLLYRKKHEEARISAAMDQEQFINVTVAQPAQMPLRPVSRGLINRFLMAALVGLLGGVGLAILLEQFLGRSFTTGEDIERKLGIPHIASIPERVVTG